MEENAPANVWATNPASNEEMDLWSETTVEDITRSLKQTNIAKGKRKAEEDLVDFYTDETDIWGDGLDFVLHLLQSGRFYQPPQVYTGSTFNPHPNPQLNPTTSRMPTLYLKMIHSQPTLQTQIKIQMTSKTFLPHQLTNLVPPLQRRAVPLAHIPNTTLEKKPIKKQLEKTPAS